jgi:Flp pilus assembly protein TadG
VGEDGRGAVTRHERRGGVAIAFMAAAPWIMLLIAAWGYLF